jgi:hypothetical protein
VDTDIGDAVGKAKTRIRSMPTIVQLLFAEL